METLAENRTWLQKITAKGFVDPPDQTIDTLWLRKNFEEGASETRIAFFLPTVYEPNAAFYTLRDLPQQLSQVLEGAPDLALDVFVAMQYGVEKENEARDALASHLDFLTDQGRELGARYGVAGALIRGFGKIHSINEMTVAAQQNGYEAVVLLDDDILLDPDCLRNLIEAYLSNSARPLAVGAKKTGLALEGLSSRLLHKVKSFTKPAENYPHACCMIVSLSIIAPRIPPIYSSDDGYICFELLEPRSLEPLQRLIVHSEATCRHFVGGPARHSLARIRRMLIHHHLFLSHYGIDKARYYAREMLFYGFWPFSGMNFREGVGFALAKWGLKFAYALWFAQIWLELIVRGIVKAPIGEVFWGGRLQPQIDDA